MQKVHEGRKRMIAGNNDRLTVKGNEGRAGRKDMTERSWREGRP
jgi:hypothetical protein